MSLGIDALLLTGRINELEETNGTLKETMEKGKLTIGSLENQIIELKKVPG